MDGHPVVLTPGTYLGMVQNLLTFNVHNFLAPYGDWGQIACSVHYCNVQYLVEKDWGKE